MIKNLQDWLVENYSRRDVIAELTRRSKLPKRTLDRRFKRATGSAPLAYVQALRVERAKQLLETTDTAVEEVAAEVGYEDPAYFRRLFTRQTGMPPGAYRRKFQLPPTISMAAAAQYVQRGPARQEAPSARP